MPGEHPGPAVSRDEVDDVVDLGRRDLIKLGAAATVAATVGLGTPLAAAAQGAAAPVFLTSAEFALLDELSEMIIPTDEHSPGARAAKVAAFIDAQLGEAFEEQERADWRAGLRRVDELSQEMNRRPFMQSSAAERLAVLTRMAQNESKPEKPEEVFFATLKSRVVDAYYSSEIGTKQEMGYLGNTYLKDFVGTDVS
jgi:hypothetical protein